MMMEANKMIKVTSLASVLVLSLATFTGLCFRGPLAIGDEGSGEGITSSNPAGSNREGHPVGGMPSSILSVFARHAFDWSKSTTPAPLSTTAVLVKEALAGRSRLRPGLESAISTGVETDGERSDRIIDVHVQPVRDFVSSELLRRVRALCELEGCNPSEADPEFGMTPLHFAQLWGSGELVDFLVSMGANPQAFDSVGRQPRNMTFQSFSSNSKKAGAARLAPGSDPEDRCEIPEVTIPLFPRQRIGRIATQEGRVAAAEEWRGGVEAALSEVRRLVSEGEPVMVRHVLHWLQEGSPGPGPRDQEDDPTLLYLSAAAFAEAWRERPVDVGRVPYAKNFELLNERMTLEDYLTSVAAQDKTPTNEGGGGTSSSKYPSYVFQMDTEACAEAYRLFKRIVRAALPSSGGKPVVCPPASGLRGLQSVHYYLGGRGTGAPFHVHSDALNLAVSGKKKWWIVTPKHAVWSKRHVKEYAEDGEGGPMAALGVSNSADGRREEVPMQCPQYGGDLVYVPGDWGHAVMNLEDETFGYTLELVNRRDTLATITGTRCEL